MVARVHLKGPELFRPGTWIHACIHVPQRAPILLPPPLSHEKYAAMRGRADVELPEALNMDPYASLQFRYAVYTGLKGLQCAGVLYVL